MGIVNLFKSTVRQPIPYMYDTFKTESSSNWIFPKKAGYDYGAKNGLWFSGDAENKVPIYSKYPWPAMGTTITGEITGDPGKCSDHFIMLSTKPQKDWSMGSSEDAIKFAWNCDELSIFPNSNRAGIHYILLHRLQGECFLHKWRDPNKT